MYIFELLIKIFRKKKNKTDYYNPLEGSIEQEDYESCEHIFMPVDSSGEMLACRNCGELIHKKDLKKKNIFNNNVID